MRSAGLALLLCSAWACGRSAVPVSSSIEGSSDDSSAGNTESPRRLAGESAEAGVRDSFEQPLSCPDFSARGGGMRTPSSRERQGQRPPSEHPFALIADLSHGRGECDASVGRSFNAITDFGPDGDCTRRVVTQDGMVAWVVTCNITTEAGHVQRREVLAVEKRAYDSSTEGALPSYRANYTIEGLMEGESFARCEYDGFVTARIESPQRFRCATPSP